MSAAMNSANMVDYVVIGVCAMQMVVGGLYVMRFNRGAAGYEFIRRSSKTAPHASIKEVFPSVELCLALAKHVEEGRAESVAVEM
jgi:hypothetical protein